MNYYYQEKNMLYYGLIIQLIKIYISIYIINYIKNIKMIQPYKDITI